MQDSRTGNAIEKELDLKTLCITTPCGDFTRGRPRSGMPPYTLRDQGVPTRAQSATSPSNAPNTRVAAGSDPPMRPVSLAFQGHSTIYLALRYHDRPLSPSRLQALDYALTAPGCRTMRAATSRRHHDGQRHREMVQPHQGFRLHPARRRIQATFSSTSRRLSAPVCPTSMTARRSPSTSKPVATAANPPPIWRWPTEPNIRAAPGAPPDKILSVIRLRPDTPF